MNDITAFCPGYYIAEIIEDAKISNTDFAKKLEIDNTTLQQLMDGKIIITKDLAVKLSTITNTSVELWQNLQKSYDEKQLKKGRK